MGVFKKEFYWNEKRIIFDEHGITSHKKSGDFYFKYEELENFEYSKLGNTISGSTEVNGKKQYFYYSTMNWDQRELKEVLKFVKNRVSNSKIKKTTFDFWGADGTWFVIAFPLSTFLLALSILLKCGATIIMVIAFAIMFAGVALGISLYLDVHLFHDMKPKKAITSKIVICVIMLIIALLTLVGKPGRSSSTRYGTCAMCGDKVPESEMIGQWCTDCNNNAFGEDGWYDKIKD